MRSLLQRGCDVNCRDGYGMSSLHYAAQHNRLEVLKLISEKGKPSWNRSDRDGWTPFIFAALNGNFECLHFLQSVGADAFHPSKNGRTCLHWAANKGNHAVLKHLLRIANEKQVVAEK